MHISIIGAGYVGLTTGVGLTQKGHEVTCIDIDKNKVSQINQGKTPIYETGLNNLLSACVNEKANLKASADYSEFLNSAITFIAGELDYKAEILQSVLKVNREQALRLVEIARKRLGSLENKVITVLGLVFKPDTDDVRRAPAFKIIAQLLEEGAAVKVYDPKAMPSAKRVLYDGIEFCNSATDAITGSDGILIVTDWDEFKDETMYAGRIVIDGRRTLNPVKARRLCRYYEGVCW